MCTDLASKLDHLYIEFLQLVNAWYLSLKYLPNIPPLGVCVSLQRAQASALLWWGISDVFSSSGSGTSVSDAGRLCMAECNCSTASLVKYLYCCASILFLAHPCCTLT